MIAIIGAGISGLTLAYRLQEQGTPYILLESSAMPGGYIQTDTKEKSILEKGPNSILADELVLDFIKELGLSQQVVEANAISKKRYVYKNGKYRTLPSGPLSLLFGSFFSFSQRLNIFKEYFNTKPYREDSTLYDLISERFGQEAADYALDPFVSGVYAGNPKELLADLCFPVLGKNIRSYGSILKGFIKNPPKRRVSLTFQQGLGTLIHALADKVENKRYACTVEDMQAAGGQWKLVCNSGQEKETLLCDRIVFALPAYQAAPIIRSHSIEWAEWFNGIEYPMVRNMHLVYKKDQLAFHPKGFGALHPRIEPLFTAGVIWNTSTFEGRTADDEILLTCMVTEKRTPSVATMSDQEAEAAILKEIEHLYQIAGKPVFAQSGLWKKGIPQYTGTMTTILNHCEELEKMNVYICSNWPHGISITDCIHRAHELATKFKI
ncbi:MAG: protoporphyrinogen oxidase [Cytophagaceae bacterium]|jgi:oxygen-dependent protoporphyrinogen oxidase|nr:protoporphyrinogen oxidase [Cytophagaceae bacterium]